MNIRTEKLISVRVGSVTSHVSDCFTLPLTGDVVLCQPDSCPTPSAESYTKKKLWLESAGANYTDRATGACRRS
jgi:hypothetical protein